MPKEKDDSKINLHEGHRLKVKKRFLREGLASFEDHNILEMILFYAIPRRDTNEIAHRLIRRFGSLSRVFDATVYELCEVDGIGEHVAILIKSYPAVAKRYYEDRFGELDYLPRYQDMGQNLVLHFAGNENEEAYAVFLDSALAVTGKEVLHQGDPNSIAFSFRKVCDAAIRNKAAYMILAHNHPRGVPVASDEDLNTTEKLKDFMLQMGIVLIDHFIVAEGKFTSLDKDAYEIFYEMLMTDDMKILNSTEKI